MATLIDGDYQWIQGWILTHPTAKEEMKAKNLPKATWRATFQALETFMVGAFTTTPASSIKAAIESVTGALTNPQALAVYDAWNAWKTFKRGSG